MAGRSDALFATTLEDLELRRRVGEVINMIRPPAALLELNVLGRVTMSTLRHRLAMAPAVAPLPGPLTARTPARREQRVRDRRTAR